MAIKGGYTLNHNAAFVGQVADGQLSDIISKLNKGDTNIPFGKGVVADEFDGAKLPTSASVAKDFVGVSVRELNRAYAHTDGTGFGAVAKKEFSVMTTGAIWVKVAEDVVARDPAYLRVGSTGTGDFCKAAGSAATLGVAIPNAKFLTSAANGEMALLSLVIGG